MAHSGMRWLCGPQWDEVVVWHTVGCTGCVAHSGMRWLCGTQWDEVVV